MYKLAIALALILPMSPAFAEVSLTGNNGTNVTKARECTRGSGQAECAVGTVYTGVDGQTATKERVRTTVPGASSTEITLTGPGGESKTRKRLLTWGN